MHAPNRRGPKRQQPQVVRGLRLLLGPERRSSVRGILGLALGGYRLAQTAAEQISSRFGEDRMAQLVGMHIVCGP